MVQTMRTRLVEPGRQVRGVGAGDGGLSGWQRGAVGATGREGSVGDAAVACCANCVTAELLAFTNKRTASCFES